jgi:hypothetical protein
LVSHLKNILHSPDFLNRHRKSPRDFSRNRQLPFPTVVLFLANLLKSSLEVELNNFFKHINGSDIACPEVSDSAFCQARKKLKYEAFIELNQEQVTFFYHNFPVRTWNDFRLLSIDGSTLRLIHTVDIAKHFSEKELSKDECPLARVSQLFDVRNKITIDAAISPYSVGERELAEQHISFLKPNDLVLLDRGYPAYWFFQSIRSKNAHFCMRMNLDHWNEVNDFYQSGKKESVITLNTCSHSLNICREKQLSIEPMLVRLIRVVLENGNVEILATSLMDSDRFPYECFAALYHERWGVEECYKIIKHRLQMENFTGKSVDSIYQDFYARIFTLNLTAIMVHPVQDDINKKSVHKKHDYQVNFTKALSNMKDSLVLLFVKSGLEKMIEKLFHLFGKKPEAKRSNRKNPRNRKTRNRQIYSMNYKPTR